MAEKREVSVNIYGQNYRLKGEQKAERMRRVASLVDREMYKVAEANPDLGITRIAIMTALSLADRLLKAQDTASEEVAPARDGSSSLSDSEEGDKAQEEKGRTDSAR